MTRPLNLTEAAAQFCRKSVVVVTKRGVRYTGTLLNINPQFTQLSVQGNLEEVRTNDVQVLDYWRMPQSYAPEAGLGLAILPQGLRGFFLCLFFAKIKAWQKICHKF